MKAFSIEQLLRVIKNMPFAMNGFEVEERGLVRAEKLHEDLITTEEAPRLWETENHYIVAPPFGDWGPVNGATRSNLDEFCSDRAEMYSDDDLQIEIQASIDALGLD
jgi:FlaA1/EpsC-like NDP-sugar epimerase